MNVFHAMIIGGLAIVFNLAGSPAQGQVCGTEEFKITPADAASEDLFGSSIAISGTAGVIGAPGDDFGKGSAYIYLVGDGTEFQKLVPDTTLFGAQFGASVASTGFNILVGAPHDVNASSTAATGAAYLFGSLGGAQIHRFLASDGANFDLFGKSVAIAGNTVAVGSPSSAGTFGSVYLFDRVSGAQLGKLNASNGLAGDQMGSSLAIDGTTIVAGAPQLQHNAEFGGAVFLFDTSTMTQGLTLFNDGSIGDEFGQSVAISGDYIVVGAPQDSQASFNAGAAYVFDRNTGGLLYKYIPASNGATNESLGTSVAINGTNAVLGGKGALNVAVVIDLLTGDPIAELKPSDSTEFHFYGTAVAISDSGVLVGAHDDDQNGVRSGAVYRFNMLPNICVADINADCAINFFDVSAFLTAFNNHNTTADLNGDGVFNFFDVSEFLSAFAAGCP